MNAPTDETLLQEFLQDKKSSLELLVRRYTPELYQFALRMTRNAAVAEDMVQETFLQLYSSAAGFDPGRRLKPWLFTIAANKCRDHLRRKERKREVPFDAQVVSGDESAPRFIDLLSTTDPPALEEEMQVEERRHLVRQIVDEMPPRLSEVLVLAYYHRFPYRDISDVLEIPLGTVKSRLHAAIAHFGNAYQAALKQRQEEAQER